MGYIFIGHSDLNYIVLHDNEKEERMACIFGRV
jgi:hypothetical protein